MPKQRRELALSNNWGLPLDLNPQRVKESEVVVQQFRGPRAGFDLSVCVLGIQARVITRSSIATQGVPASGKTSERIVLMSPSESEPAGSQKNEPAPWIGMRGRLADWTRPRTAGRSKRRASIGPPMIGQQTPQSTFGTHYILRGVATFSRQRIMGHRRLGASTVCVGMSTELVQRQHGKFSDNDPGQQSAAATEKEDACPDARRL